MNQTRTRRKQRWLLWTGLVVLVLMIAGVSVAVARGRDPKIPDARLAKVTRGDIAKSVVATGPIQPITKVELKSKASGLVEKLYVDINQMVTKGQVLAQLDQQEILAQVAAQRAQLAAAQANVGTFAANVAQDKVNAEAPDLPMYKETYDRNLQMLKDGIVSQQTLDNAERDYLGQKNKRDGAIAQIGVDQAKLKQAEAQVQQAQASLDQLNEQLSYTTLVAPIDGMVLSRDVEVGDAVSSILVLGSTATLVMTIGDIHQVYVDGKVDEADIGNVYLGQPARIHVESFPNKIFNGKVTKISPLGVEKDNVTTFEVRVSIDNPGGEIKALMTANAEIIVTEHHNALSVPEQAMTWDSNKNAFVFVPDSKDKDGQRKIPVTAGISNGSRTEILSGLKEGDTVVLQQ
ncbi:MAG TPA: efflux RND transporter periplasmic adaptor subunit [Acidobacteriaceae bacterium]|nr:efflux RND transporter periplasmic adaptor subunit [Acidobacteriaceae bacterium]